MSLNPGDRIEITQGAELPDITITWKYQDGSGLWQLVPFLSGYTFALRIGYPGRVATINKVTGFTGADVDPNLTISFLSGELDGLMPDMTYEAQAWARRTVDSKDREPFKFAIKYKAAVL
jgi:hypothetical protein